MVTSNKSQAELDHDAKWALAVKRAQRTAKWAKTMTKVLISQSNGTQPRWHVINLVSPKGTEPRGIVDLLAIRRNQEPTDAPLNRGDLFEVVLLQVKGGKASRPTERDRERLRLVGKRYGATAILLSEWKKGATPTIYRLNGDAWGDPIEPAEVFCPNGKLTTKKKAGRPTSKAGVVITASKSISAPSTSEAPNPRTIAAKKAWATRKAAAKLGKKK